MPRAPISERPAGPLALQCLAVPGRNAMAFFVGLDWASQEHAVCLLDDTGQVCWQGSIVHSAAGLAELLRRLARFGPPASLPVAIERPSGLIVDALMDAGPGRPHSPQRSQGQPAPLLGGGEQE